jgi:hypothetical protein
LAASKSGVAHALVNVTRTIKNKHLFTLKTSREVSRWSMERIVKQTGVRRTVTAHRIDRAPSRLANPSDSLAASHDPVLGSRS